MSRRLVFEIGTEEIPSAALYDAIAQLAVSADRALTDARLEHGALATYASPRRLVLIVEELAERQEDLSTRARGPAAAVAFDAAGAPTPAAAGFARGKGVAVEDLVTGEEGGGTYVFALVERPGSPATDVLPGLLSKLVTSLDWPKSQRWGSGPERFIRPVRWLMALFGSDVVPATFGSLSAGRLTWGHRFLAPGPMKIASAGDYESAMDAGKVVFDQARRAFLISEGIEAVATRGEWRAVVPERTLAEVVNLVEAPTVAAGTFDEEFLVVPREVLETAMTKHQRYFPVESANGSLANAFIVVHNGDPAQTAPIVRGHERVIRARLADGAFFYNEDLRTSMETWVAQLGSIVFQEELGMLGDKVARMEALTSTLAGMHGASADELRDAVRSAHLAKADLVSHVVVEFPVLQGVMGRYYALSSGESPAVAAAIPEHYRPRFSGDELPASTPGMLVSAADKLDTMAGIFAIGRAPTGSADPYALRRGAIGVLAMILEGGLHITDLEGAVAAAVAGYGTGGPVDVLGRKDVDPAEVVGRIMDFLRARLEVMLRDRGVPYDIVAAVIAQSRPPLDVADAASRARALAAFRGTDAGQDLLVAFKRAANLADPGAGIEPATPGMMTAEEIALARALDAAEARFRTDVTELHDYDAALALLATMRGAVDEFFDKVLVMDPDPSMRQNRLALLNRVVALFDGFADLGALEG